MDTLLRNVEQAFAGPPLAPDTAIAVPIDDDEGVSSFFGGKAWGELSAEHLRANAFAPTILTPEAFAYFAPAYIRAYMVDPVALDSVVESFVINLGSTGDPTQPQFHRARRIKALFTAAQQEVVHRFLVLYGETEGDCAAEMYFDALHLYGGPQCAF